MMGRRMMRRRGILGAAVAVSAVSSARTNRAVRKNIEAQNAAQSEDAQVAPQDDTTAQLTQLKNLLDQGILTQEEFDAKKKQILGL